MTTAPAAVAAPGAALAERRTPLARTLGRAAVWVVVAAVVAWIGFLAEDPAVSEFGAFVVRVLEGLTTAGLLFVVASGFTLIFGLMRTVNMAHGSLFLLAAFLAVEFQQALVGQERNIDPVDVSMLSWVAPALAGALLAAGVGVLLHQALLRWNQGQELRQALITIAVSAIVADQLLSSFPTAQRITWPDAVEAHFEILGERFPATRLFMLGVAVLVGVLLWLWLGKTRTGMIIRAGVDDQPMVRALGISISRVLALTFFVGAFLAGLGGALGASASGAATGADGQWLLNSLIVVIVGGMGSIKGAIAGAVLLGLVEALAPAYLPSGLVTYSDIVTFVLLAVVLAVRPYGLFGREA